MPDGAPLIHPDVVAGRIAALLRDRRPGAVRPLLAALEKLAPDYQDLVLLRVAYFCQMEDFGEALRVMADAIARQPKNPALYLKRAEILFGQADYAAAAENAADAILLAPNFSRAKSALGLALLKLGRFEQALPCLAEGFNADPASVDVALALAALAPDTAVETLNRAIAATPNLAVLRNALTRRHLCAGNTAEAIRNAALTRTDGLANAESFCLLAFGQLQEGHWDDAGISVSQAQSLAPGDRWVSRLSDAMGQSLSGQLRPPPSQNPLSDEQALLSAGTVLPGTFKNLLQESKARGPVLDLFCGTGLNAIAARDSCPGPWTGIDPDAGLLNLCGERGLYARLEASNPLDFLEAGTQYSVILLNEALAYTASPLSWFTAVRACLSSGGMALAAIGTGRPGLTGHGLFAHDLAHVVEDAHRAGLSLNLKNSGTLRYVEGIPLRGLVASLQPA